MECRYCNGNMRASQQHGFIKKDFKYPGVCDMCRTSAEMMPITMCFMKDSTVSLSLIPNLAEKPFDVEKMVTANLMQKEVAQLLDLSYKASYKVDPEVSALCDIIWRSLPTAIAKAFKVI